MQNQNALPDPQTAYNNLFAGVKQRVFFSKLAAAGHRPQTAAQAEWMLDTAAKLRASNESRLAKQAQEHNDPYQLMNEALRSVLIKQGHDVGPAPGEMNLDWAHKQAAAEFAQDPVLYNSVLALRAQEAQELQQQLAAGQTA